jgi:hypothetical protein
LAYGSSKKTEANNWVQALNRLACHPQLDHAEVKKITSSNTKKKWHYGCKGAHLKPYCDAALCRLRPYGVGRQDAVDTATFPQFIRLRKLQGHNEAVWFWDLEDGRSLKLSTEELQSPRMFQKRCLESLDIFPAVPTNVAWQKFVAEALQNVVIKELPEDASDEGQLGEALERFLGGTLQAKSKDELLIDKPWNNGEGITWFTLRSFLRYLFTQQIRNKLVNPNGVGVWLRSIGALEDRFTIKSKKPRVWGVPTPEGMPEIPVPPGVNNDKAPF